MMYGKVFLPLQHNLSKLLMPQNPQDLYCVLRDLFATPRPTWCAARIILE